MEAKILDAIKRIACSLGTGSGRRTFTDASGLTVMYEAECAEVFVGTEVVFRHCGGTVEVYRPGAWETVLFGLVPAADRAKETADQGSESEARSEGERPNKLRESWGLSSDDARKRGGGDPRKSSPGGPLDRPAGGS